MKLKLIRTARKDKYTIGHLYMLDKENGQWVILCDTIEAVEAYNITTDYPQQLILTPEWLRSLT